MRQFIASLGSGGGEVIPPTTTYLICAQMGQSNAESNSAVIYADIPTPYGDVQNNVLTTTMNIADFAFQPLEFNVNNFSAFYRGIGPVDVDNGGVELKLWKDIADATGKNILLIHLAYGGEGFEVGSEWNLNTGSAWTDYADAWASLRAFIAANNLVTEPGFIFWAQGENNITKSDYFTVDLPTAFSRFRAEFGSNVHIYSGEVNRNRGASWVTFANNQANYIDPAGEYTLMSNTDKVWEDDGTATTGIHLTFASNFLLADQIKALYLASL